MLSLFKFLCEENAIVNIILFKQKILTNLTLNINRIQSQEKSTHSKKICIYYNNKNNGTYQIKVTRESTRTFWLKK